VYGTLATLLLLVSLGEFGILYNLIMPKLHSSDTLYFDYTGTSAANYMPSQVPHSVVPNAAGTAAAAAAAAIQTSTEHETTNLFDDDDDRDDVVCDAENSTTTEKVAFSPPKVSWNPFQNKEHFETSRRSMQSAPVAVVDLFSNHVSWQYYHPDVVLPPKQAKHILTKGAPHYIEVLLDLPESEVNRNKIGMFSVVVDLHSSSSSKDDEASDTGGTAATLTTTTTTLLASSTRGARIPHESHWISVFRKFLCILPHVFGAMPESRRVTVPSFRFFVESEEFPLRYVTVRLLVSPENRQRGEQVEVGAGILHIGEEMVGLQLILKEWFFTCLTIGTTVLFVWQLTLAFALQSLLEYRRQLRREEERERERERDRIILEDDVSEGLGLAGFDDDVPHGNGDGGAREESSTDNVGDAGSSGGQQGNTDNIGHEIEGETGLWEDLTEQGSRSTLPNTGDDNENTRSTTRGDPQPSTEEPRHTIPDY